MARAKFISIRILSLLIVPLLIPYVYGQDEFEEWLQKDNEKLSKFIKEDDKRFVEFLKREWIEIGLQRQVPFYQKPKPKTLPVYKSYPDAQTEPSIIDADDIPKVFGDEFTNIEKLQPPNVESPVNVGSEERSDQSPSSIARVLEIDLKANNLMTELNFYSASIQYYYNDNLIVGIEGELSRDKIAAYWKKLSAADYNVVLSQAQYYKDNMNLNDWGYCELLFNYSRVMQKSSIDEGYLFTWFMLVKSGYLVRIGYEGNRVALLIATDNKMYGLPYFFPEASKQTFYSISLDPDTKPLTGNLFIYKDDYPGLNKLFNLRITETPTISFSLVDKELEFNIAGIDYSIPIRYDKSAIEFFDYYPQTEFSVYFSAPMSTYASESLLGELGSLIEGKNEVEAANFLLHFVQYVTGYEIDEEQFKREKPFFPEESLHYNYSDCEDRAVLFSYLVKNLLKLEVVGIDYPEHVATAVHFRSDIDGSYIEHNDKKYFICDPTYLGASVGVCIPEYVNVKADIISI